MKTALQSTLLLFTCLLPLTAFAAPRYVTSVDGTEITDQKTGLVWRRCTEGMSWNGTTCAGSASPFTHQAALQHAMTQTGSAGWRLPNVKELASITDISIGNPAIDSTIFPATPLNPFWTSTPFVADTAYTWVVDFGTGAAGGTPRSNSYYARLVHDGP